jgi:hypothetical protein
MSARYPWYEIVSGSELQQGDFLDDCPIIVPPEKFVVPEGTGRVENVKVNVQTYDVLIMSQSCDLVQEKIDLVLVCPHWSLSEIEQANQFFRSDRGKEEIRRGNVPGYHMLASCELEGFEKEVRVVDFRAVFSLPMDFVKDFASRKGRRVRLLPPYREHLSQAFARFFMRVGLPVNIPAFR